MCSEIIRLIFQRLRKHVEEIIVEQIISFQHEKITRHYGKIKKKCCFLRSSYVFGKRKM